MAGVALRDVVLYDKWPGPVNPNIGRPANGFGSTVSGSGNCVTTAVYPVGTKIMTLNDGTYNPGWSTMCYMQFAEGSSAAYDCDTDVSNGLAVCGHYEVTSHHPDGDNAGTWYVVTNNTIDSDMTSSQRIAIACCDFSGADTTSTGAEFGWFWVGGVCPCVTGPSPHIDCTKFSLSVLTDGDVVAGEELCVIAASDTVAATTGLTVFRPYGNTTMWVADAGDDSDAFDATALGTPIGYATAADA